LDWIHLVVSHEIKEMADLLSIADIMEVRTSNPQDAGFTKIPIDGKHNWIRLKPGMEKAAAFLETRRYAAYKGASMGFAKMEGATVNARDKIAYSAMSYIQSSMLDGSSDIRVEGPRAGAIYALPLQGGQKDNNGKPSDARLGRLQHHGGLFQPGVHAGSRRKCRRQPRFRPHAPLHKRPAGHRLQLPSHQE
jgi:hypothetical protein